MPNKISAHSSDSYEDWVQAENYPREIGEIIQRHQWLLQGVMGDDENLPFMYTIGNYEVGLPEQAAKGKGCCACGCSASGQQPR